MSEEATDNPLEQLIELLVYAPVGLLYEYEEVLPKLVRRGRSQVQLARVLGRMAVDQKGSGAATGQDPVAALLSMLAGLAGDVLKGACPPEPAPKPDRAADRAAEAADGSQSTPDRPEPASAPIAHYDKLTAREIIPLLDDLDADQLSRLRQVELDGRARKTVLGKIDRLLG